MKVKNWLIHKLGGVAKEEIAPPMQYNVYHLKVETIKAQFADRGENVPQEYVEEMLMRDLVSAIKPYIKIEKLINYFGEYFYNAEINVVEVRE